MADETRQGRINAEFKKLLLVISVGIAIWPCCSSALQADLSLGTRSRPAGLVVIGTEFYQATSFDEGIIRIFLRNAGSSPVTVKNCQLQLVATSWAPEQDRQESSPVKCLYFRLDPAEILPGQVGELLIRPSRKPFAEDLLRCSILTSDDQQITADVPVHLAPLRISYVGFSEDLSKIYVFIGNNSDRPMQVALDEVNDYEISNEEEGIGGELLPASDTCLVFAPAFPLKHGEYVHVQVSGKSSDSTVRTNAVTRVFGEFPLTDTSGGGDPELGLKPITAKSMDYNGPVCICGMECMSHAHGTPTEAANKLKNLRQSIIAEDPEKFVYILFCWPRTDLHQLAPFFQLSDLPALNTCKNSYQQTSSAPQTYRDSFHPHLWRAQQALALSSPRPFIAVVPVGPDAKASGFDDDLPSTDYIRFMAYSAIAGGAKGIYYRITSQHIEDPIRRREFARLNKELRLLKPLLVVSQPVAEAKTNDENTYAGALRCGNEALLVILLNKAHPGNPNAAASLEQSGSSLTLRIPIPAGFSVREVQDLYALISSSHWSLDDGILKVDHIMTESAETLKIMLERIPEQHSIQGIEE